MSKEILATAGVAAKPVTTTPLNLLAQSDESYEVPLNGGSRWRLNVAATTTDITVKVYARVNANATSGLVELVGLRTAVVAGTPASIDGNGECAQTLKVMGYTARGTATVNASMIVGG